jgi:hypothetical protein
MSKAIQEFIRMVQNEAFAPAHEVLESDWLAYKKEYKTTHQKTTYKKAKAIQGLINGTTALALHKKQKIQGYKKVWATFLKYETLLDEITLPQHHYFLQARQLLFEKNKEVLSS